MHVLFAVVLLQPFMASLAPVIGREQLKAAPRVVTVDRLAARVRNLPVYEWEVRHAVYQRLPEFMNLSASERSGKQVEMFKEELRRIIERELILDEVFTLLNANKQTATLSQLNEGARTDADQRIREILKCASLSSEDDLKMFLHNQGLTLAGIRRHFERSFISGAYLGDRIRPKLELIGLTEIKDYYDSHLEEFRTKDVVKWQNLFIRADRFRNSSDAKKHAELLMKRATKEDFVKLADDCDQGTSKANGGFGYGEKRGEISPPDLEATIFDMKPGEVKLIDIESGYHIVRIAERAYPSQRALADTDVQSEIRKRLQSQILEREYRRIVDLIWENAKSDVLILNDQEKSPADANEHWKLAAANWQRAKEKGLSGTYLADGDVLTLADLRDRGAVQMRNGDFDKAIADCSEAIRLDAKDAAAFRIRGLAAIGKKDFGKAIADLSEAIRLNSNDAEARLMRGIACVQNEEFNRAIIDFNALIDPELKDGRALIWRASCYARQQYFDVAIADCNQFIRRQPDDAMALVLRADCYAYKSALDLAIADYSAALKLAPNLAQAWRNRADCRLAKMDYADCIGDYRAAIRLDPNDLKALKNVAALLSIAPVSELRDGQEALRHATKACELTHWKDPEALAALAGAYAECGDFKRATRWEKKVIELGFGDRDADRRAAQRLRMYEEGKPYRVYAAEK